MQACCFAIFSESLLSNEGFPQRLLLLLCLQYGYRLSKAALNMAGKLLAEDLAAQHIPVGIIHPGPVSARPHMACQGLV